MSGGSSSKARAALRAHSLADTVGTVPNTDNKRLFLPQVPQRSDSHERRISDAFDSAREDAQSQEGPETVAGSLAAEEDTP